VNPPINRHRWIVAAVLLTFLAGNYVAFAQDLPTAKPEDVGVSSEKVAELSTFMQSLVDDGKIAGGVTMMARHGKVVHLEAVGMADRESGKPMTTDAIFRIASMTKPVTSVAIMMLWEEGKLDLDDPVSKFIPEFANPQGAGVR
jgi:CubicO group peptidase (beta-lactamase class C family)